MKLASPNPLGNFWNPWLLTSAQLMAHPISIFASIQPAKSSSASRPILPSKALTNVPPVNFYPLFPNACLHLMPRLKEYPRAPYLARLVPHDARWFPHRWLVSRCRRSILCHWHERSRLYARPRSCRTHHTNHSRITISSRTKKSSPISLPTEISIPRKSYNSTFTHKTERQAALSIIA